jgi:hypothetical protein
MSISMVILAVLILYGIASIHSLHYKHDLHEKALKDMWGAMQALKLKLEGIELTNMDETFIAAFERMDERLSRLEPEVDDS